MKNEFTPQIAAMYIGQKCDAVDYNGVPIGLKRITGDLVQRIQNNLLTITPHLRPISSLTEDEARELYAVAKEPHKEWPTRHDWMKEDDADRECLTDWWNAQEEYFMEESRFKIGSSAVWMKLLEWGFDLFGLIDAGLAKEKVLE